MAFLQQKQLTASTLLLDRNGWNVPYLSWYCRARHSRIVVDAWIILIPNTANRWAHTVFSSLCLILTSCKAVFIYYMYGVQGECKVNRHYIFSLKLIVTYYRNTVIWSMLLLHTSNGRKMLYSDQNEILLEGSDILGASWGIVGIFRTG